MAHFAQLDENNVVTQVIVVHNSELVESKQTTVNEDGSVSVAVVESEQRGIDFCKSLFGDALTSIDVQALTSSDVQALTSADISALTTSDISSLG